MARGFDPVIRPQTTDLGVGALMQNLIGIQERRQQRELQERAQARLEEEAARQAQQEAEDRALKAAELETALASARERPQAPVPFEERARAGEAAEMIPDTPEERAAWETGTQVTAPTPTPTRKVSFGGLQLDIPLEDIGERRAREEEEFTRKLEQARRTKLAEGATELTPEMIAAMPEEMQPFFQPKQLTEAPSLSSAVAARLRPTRQNYQRVEIDGVEAMATPEEIAAAKAEGKTVAPYHPAPAAGIGVLIPVTDAAGGVQGFYNNRTGQFQGLGGGFPEGVRRSGVPAGEMAQRGTLQSILSDAEELERLAAGEAGKSIGPVAGRVTGITRGILGAPQDVQDLFHIADNLSDQLLRARSGAQINEQEYKRLRQLVPNPRDERSKFTADLRRFQIEAANVLSARQGGAVDDEADLPAGPGRR